MDIGPIFSFLAGIASILSPCIIPVIPIVIGHSLLNRKKSDIISFIIGFYSIFTLIIILTVIFTAAINYYLFYFRIIASIIILVIGIILIVNGRLLNFPSTHRTVKNPLSSTLMGVLTSLAWAPCYGAYLIALIAYNVSTGNLGYTIINLTLFTLGFSLTLLLIAFLTSKINLKKIIQYTNWIRIISGIIIFTAGLFLLLNLFGLINLQ